MTRPPHFLGAAENCAQLQPLARFQDQKKSPTQADVLLAAWFRRVASLGPRICAPWTAFRACQQGCQIKQMRKHRHNMCLTVVVDRCSTCHGLQHAMQLHATQPMDASRLQLQRALQHVPVRGTCKQQLLHNSQSGEAGTGCKHTQSRHTRMFSWGCISDTSTQALGFILRYETQSDLHANDLPHPPSHLRQSRCGRRACCHVRDTLLGSKDVAHVGPALGRARLPAEHSLFCGAELFKTRPRCLGVHVMHPQTFT